MKSLLNKILWKSCPVQLQVITVLVLIEIELNFFLGAGTVLEFSFFSCLFSSPCGVGLWRLMGRGGKRRQRMSKCHSGFSCHLGLNHDSSFLASFASSPVPSLFNFVLLCQALFWELRKEHVSNWNKLK